MQSVVSEPLVVPSPSQRSGWHGQLDLVFESRSAQTVLTHAQHLGPLRVQRPFREPNGGCQVYVLNPPGGLVGGDDLCIDARLAQGARALLTNPGATKFYRSAGAAATQRQVFTLAAGSHLEWLPQETIVYDGARAEQATRVELTRGASFFGWEVTCLGRPASGDLFPRGSLRQTWDLVHDGKLIWSERTRIEADAPIRHALWGLASRPVFATLIAYPVNEAGLEAARSALTEAPASAETPEQPAVESSTVSQSSAWLGATLLGDALICRYLGFKSREALATFTRVWSSLRPTHFGCLAVPPRIWAT